VYSSRPPVPRSSSFSIAFELKSVGAQRKFAHLSFGPTEALWVQLAETRAEDSQPVCSASQVKSSAIAALS
jgi:hypothetical protein